MELCDVTLREGNQMPGRSYSAAQKVEAGCELDRLGIEYIQAGFAATGREDQEAISELAVTVDADVVSLARAIVSDVSLAVDCDSDIVEVFCPVSDLQLENTIQKSRSEVLASLEESVDYAHDHGLGVFLSITDAFRTPLDRIVDIFERFPNAQYISLADAVGICTPARLQDYVDRLSDAVEFSRTAVHFHDDLGLGTANTLLARDLGIGKADVSVAALGERAGNAPLEQAVVASAIEQDNPLRVHAEELIPVCLNVLDILDEEISPRRPLLGEEVFQHESGLHTAAMLRDPSVFEPFDPSKFGGQRQLVFGSKTGHRAAELLLEAAGVEGDRETIDRFLKELAQREGLSAEEAVDLAKRL